ncbi:MAG: PepSY-associated TM helix domain-containing protein [Vicinamibacterales bacterium]|nr:PepSY-associated TM helix domain-containing protein [Vicinamibacterales bacterium]
MFYRWTRDLHLYFGLFISPFLLLFAVSVFFLNHGKVIPDRWSSVRTIQDLRIPDGITSAQGRAAIERAQALLPQIGVTGEIGFTRVARQTGHFAFPISKAGLETSVDVDVQARTATVSERPTSLLEATAYLHKMPGPHNVAIRGNWISTQIWRWFADATIYLTLFITLSGLYLWWVLKAERRTGLVFLSMGVLTFFGLIYAVIR